MESKWLELASVAADWLQLFVALATGVATAVWAVWKLTNERRADSTSLISWTMWRVYTALRCFPGGAERRTGTPIGGDGLKREGSIVQLTRELEPQLTCCGFHRIMHM